MNESFLYISGGACGRLWETRSVFQAIVENAAATFVPAHNPSLTPLSPGVSGVFHNRGSVHRPYPRAQIRSPETTGEPKKHGRVAGNENDKASVRGKYHRRALHHGCGKRPTSGNLHAKPRDGARLLRSGELYQKREAEGSGQSPWESTLRKPLTANSPGMTA